MPSGHRCPGAIPASQLGTERIGPGGRVVPWSWGGCSLSSLWPCSVGRRRYCWVSLFLQLQTTSGKCLVLGLALLMGVMGQY